MNNGNILRNVRIIMKRELASYFGSPVAYVFIVIFLLLTGFFTFYISNFFEAGQADLKGFVQWHPWLFMFLVPAVAMRLWAEERRLGTIELLLTLATPRKDCKDAAKAALARFKTLQGVLDAAPADLCRLPGIGFASSIDTPGCWLP